jgi:hypothetical protein
MEEWLVKIRCFAAQAGEWWATLTGLGVVAGVPITWTWIRKIMVRRAARTIYEHMRTQQEAAQRIGKGERILLDVTGIPWAHQNAHRCDAACLKRGQVLKGPMCWFIDSAFKRLCDEHKTTPYGGYYYISGSEPK